MNCMEEQNMEVEVLQSIYSDDMHGTVCFTAYYMISVEPQHRFTIPIQSDVIGCSEAEGFKCNIYFELPTEYPNTTPGIEVQDENFENPDTLLKHLKEEADKMIGTVMVFTLVSEAQDWLNRLWDEERQKQQANEALRKKEEEEAEMKRFTGTPVTVENFLKWKQLFMLEEVQLKKKEKEEKDSKKLTGKELFLQDKSLNESDLKFLEEGDDVKVDESLFEDLEDLVLDDDEEGEETENVS
ncbi:hypothetical protein B566_EDAN007054 [Ephemera danica]|nr:hypothetical protein B566_EDAN007054 [Ephemera danica]